MQRFYTSIATLVLAVPAATQHWTTTRPATSPSVRSHYGLAFDPLRGKVVLFGGEKAGRAPLGDTWEWDGKNWTRMRPLRSPSARSAMSMRFDPITKRVLLFGGWDGSHYDDTWSWDGTIWTKLPTKAAPSPRRQHHMAVDPNSNGLLVYGGYKTHQHHSDTWIWNGSNWVQRASSGPPVSHAYGIASDPVNGHVVLYGGAGSNSLAGSRQTWLWDGKTWTRARPKNSPPFLRDPAMLWHVGLQRVVLQGGQDPTLKEYADTWAWDGGDWSKLATPALGPRHAHQIVWDGWRARAVSFGALANWQLQSDTIQYHGPWLSASKSTLPRSGGTMQLRFEAGQQNAARLYLLLGSASGTAPGLNLGGPHLQLPLNYADWYFDYLNRFKNWLVTPSIGYLSGLGQGTATMNLPPLPKGFPKLTLHHAFVVFSYPSPGPLFAGTSNAVPLELN